MLFHSLGPALQRSIWDEAALGMVSSLVGCKVWLLDQSSVRGGLSCIPVTALCVFSSPLCLLLHLGFPAAARPVMQS